MIIIKKISWEEILPIWQTKLWPKSVRQSPIEPNSAMCFFKQWQTNDDGVRELNEYYDLENMKFTPTFWGCFDGDKLIGVNSGHMCINKEYRSRGLWVDPEYRGVLLGTKLLMKTISQGYHEGAVLCWSYPRLESWHTYQKAGFQQKGHNFWCEWEESETGTNSKCALVFDENIKIDSVYPSASQK
jgi:GNAT superfamily N-acetyltransferase